MQKIVLKFLCGILFFLAFKVYAFDNNLIKSAKNAGEVETYISSIPNNAKLLILLDIDDTIITPVSKAFRVAPYNQLIEEIKQNKKSYPIAQFVEKLHGSL